MKERGRAIWKAVELKTIEENGLFLDNALSTLNSKSLIIYFNHFSLLDPGVLLKSLQHHQKGRLDNVYVFTSRRHMDPSQGYALKFQSAIVNSVSKSEGFIPIEIIQKKDLDKYKEATKYNFEMLRKAIETLNTTGNIVLIAPEGERSRTGGLQNADRTLELLLERSKNTALAYPVAMPHKSKIVPYFTTTRLIYGASTFSYEQLKNEVADKRQQDGQNLTITDIMMIKLASLLPNKNRGCYARFFE